MVGQELLGVGILDESAEFGEFFERTIGFLEGLEAVATHLDAMAFVLFFDQHFMRALLPLSGDKNFC